MPRKSDYPISVGDKFTRLTVTKFIGRKGHNTMWKCRCDCGNERIVSQSNLKSGHSKSCGCLSSEIKGNINFKTGLSASRLYRVYWQMVRRCHCSKDASYKYYGKRGIEVCDEWRGEHGFEHFADWAFENGYCDRKEGEKRNHITLDRVNVNGNYEPQNCRWVSMAEQNNNRRCNVKISIDGETKNIAEWCELYEMPYELVRRRIRDYGWDAKKALTQPSRSKKQIYERQVE